jgi:hypothetical protein
MQIHEITEGFWQNVGSGFVQGVTGANFTQPAPVNIAGARAAQGADQSQPIEKKTLTISQPGQTVDTKYFKTGTVWTNEQGQQITKPDSIAYLEKLIPTHGTKEIVAPPAKTSTRKVSRRRPKL